MNTGSPGITRIFEIRNAGMSVLTLGTVSVPSGFSILQYPPAFLEPGERGYLEVQISTAQAGARGGQIRFTTNDSDYPVFDFAIKGTVLYSPPEVAVHGGILSITDGDATPGLGDGTDFGSAPVASAGVTRTFTVSNMGGSPLSLGTVSLPAGFVLLEGLSPTLQPGTSDMFQVRLTTGAAGVRSGHIAFATNDSDEPVFNFAVKGSVIATPPEVTVIGGGVVIADGDKHPALGDGTDFGTMPIGSPGVVRTFTVRNDGGSPLSLGRVSVPSGFLLIDGLVATLAPGASDTFQVRMSTDTATSRSGQISFTTSDADENIFNFAVKGVVARTPPEVTVLGNRLNITDGDTLPSTSDHTNFGTTPVGGLEVTRTFTVRNDGGLPLSLGRVSVPAGFTLVQDLVSTLDPGASDTFRVRMDATVAGPRGGQISFTTNDTSEPLFNFAVEGNVSGHRPDATVTGNKTPIADGDATPTLADHTDFGKVSIGSAGVTRTFTVRNSGGETLTLGKLVVPSGFTVVDGLVPSLAPGASDTFEVGLNTASAGVFGGHVTFRTNNGSEPVFNFAIKGTVASSPPEVTVLGNGVSITDGDAFPALGDHTDFGDVQMGAKGFARVFTVRNDGNETLKLGSVSVPAGFILTDGLVPSLAPGKSDTFSVRLDQSRQQSSSGQISFTTNDPNEGVFNFAVKGRVTATEPEAVVRGNGIEIVDGDTSPSRLDGTDFGRIPMGTSIHNSVARRRTFDLWNDGWGTLTLGKISVPAGFELVSDTPWDAPPSFISREVGTSNGNSSFKVRFIGTTPGMYQGQVSFATNDSSEPIYNFTVRAEVVQGPAEVTVLGNGVTIASGDTQPDLADHTDFGTAASAAEGVIRTFTVRNDGSETLRLGPVTLPPGFVLVDGLQSSLGPGDSDSFRVRMIGEAGIRSGRISFATNDQDERDFSFAVKGILPSLGPEVTVLYGTRNIPDGYAALTAKDGTDFGIAYAGGPGVTRSFTVRNDGGSALKLGAVTVPSGFTVTNGLAGSLAPGASDTFEVRLNASAAGSPHGEIRFSTNDSDEAIFNFSVKGTVVGRATTLGGLSDANWNAVAQEAAHLNGGSGPDDDFAYWARLTSAQKSEVIAISDELRGSIFGGMTRGHQALVGYGYDHMAAETASPSGRFHGGIDYKALAGDEVYSPVSGDIVYAGNLDIAEHKDTFGVVILDEVSRKYWILGHLTPPMGGKSWPSGRVQAGDTLIGNVANHGSSSSADDRLHVEVQSHNEWASPDGIGDYRWGGGNNLASVFSVTENPLQIYYDHWFRPE